MKEWQPGSNTVQVWGRLRQGGGGGWAPGPLCWVDGAAAPQAQAKQLQCHRRWESSQSSHPELSVWNMIPLNLTAPSTEGGKIHSGDYSDRALTGFLSLEGNFSLASFHPLLHIRTLSPRSVRFPVGSPHQNTVGCLSLLHWHSPH